MKSTVILGTASRTAGKLFFALILLLLAVAIGFGGTALVVYHQLGTASHPAARLERSTTGEHRTPARPVQTATEQSQQTRRVAAMPSDQPQYTYADNSGGKPSAPAKRSRPTTNVPAPLDPSFQAANATDASGRLDDPESHYIVDARTGRVVGIDGSAGARREEAEEQLQQSNTAPETVAAQTPAPEIRVASPVIEAGQPVYHGAPPASVNVSGSQYVPVRKALPVTADEVNAAPRAFNAGEYRLTNQDRPVLRAQPVIPTGARVVKTVRIYHLPDGTQTVAVD